MSSDLLWQYLLNNDLIGFLLACFTAKIGQITFVILTMFFTAPLYIRTRNLAILGVVWILLGGGFVMAMPIVAPMAVLLVAFGLTAVFYKLFQGHVD